LGHALVGGALGYLLPRDLIPGPLIAVVVVQVGIILIRLAERRT
jgi:hypothetical protein